MAEDRTEEVMREFKYAANHRKKIWDALEKRASEYVKGNQWTEQEKRDMESKRRVPATFNMILPAIDLIMGHWLQSRMDLIARPVDEFGDVELADIITATTKYIEYCNMMPMQDKYQFRSGLIRGVGVKELWYDYDKNPKGDIRCQYRRGSDYHLDPDTTQYDLSDCNRVFKTIWMSHQDLVRTYGKAKAEKAWTRYSYFSGMQADDLLDQITDPTWGDKKSNDYGNLSSRGRTGEGKMAGEDPDAFDYVLTMGYDLKKKLVRVVERYEKRYEEMEYVYDPGSGNTARLEDYPKEFHPLLKDSTIKRVEHHIHLTSVIGDSIEGEDAALDAKEFSQLFNFFFPYWDDGKYLGVVENLFYPQDEINQRHATLVHVISTLAARGFLYEDGALEEETEGDLETRLSTPGYTLKLEKDAISQGKVRFQENLAVPSVFEHLEDREAYNIKYISGATDAIQGISPRIQSGSAKQTEIAQAAVRLTPILDNWKDSKLLCARAITWWIQHYFTEERVIRIMSPEHMEQSQQIEINKRALGTVFNDVTIGEYDFVWEWEGMTKTERERIMFRLTDLANTVPAYAQAIADEVIMMSDLPGKWRIIQKFQQIQQAQAQQAQAQQAQMAQQNGIPGSPGGARRTPMMLRQ